MTNAVKILVHDSGNGMCALSGKEADGLTVSFEDGTVIQQHLSWKSFRQLVAMKTVQAATKPSPKPMPVGIVPPAIPVATVGNPVVK